MRNLFGYLRAEKGELLVREYEQYKAVYCTLCKQLGKDYSVFSRFILSYDFTFFAMISLSLDDNCPGYEQKHCTCNPLKKCSCCINGESSFKKAAALSVITAYYKLCDDILDSSFLKKLRSIILKPIFGMWHKKAAMNFPEYEKIVSEMMKAQDEVENSNVCHLDMAAEPTANMLAQILSTEAVTNEQKTVLYQLGYQLGRWVYLIDAVDDFDDDKKRQNFNPFLLEQTSDCVSIKKCCVPVLNQCIAQVYNAFNLLELKHFSSILDNILSIGLQSEQNRIINMKKGKSLNK